ncbi:hypothetical protein K438DRAFT_1800531 [Mycena galopus ATCC 62051]|nr:hypothetical protein K438DRAFT_1800531 [Mycena galopus ATCC 62051]
MFLPLELFELIIDNIDDISLKMCSLVCSAFHHLSEPRIYRRVTLLPRPSDATLTDNTMCFLFHRKITQVPRIQQYVRTLVIMDRAMYEPDSPDTRARRTEEWILDEPTLPSLLQLLPNLESFHLHTRTPWQRVLDQNPSLASTILTVLASPNIESIHMRGLSGTPVFRLIESPGLQDLLLNTSLKMTNDTHTVPTIPKVCIRRLGLWLWGLDWFAGDDCPFDTTHLLKLRVCLEHDIEQGSALQTLLNTSSNSLLEFEYLRWIASDVPAPLDLSAHSSLRRLVVWVRVGKVGDSFGQMFWLVRTLDSLPQGSTIRDITIHLEVFSPLWSEPIEELAWATLDASLTRPNLHASEIKIFTNLNLDRFLPILSSSGRMYIKTPITSDSLRFADL